MNPRGQRTRLVLRASSRSAEEKGLLPSGDDAPADDVGKKLAHPRAAREHELVRVERAAVRQDEARHPRAGRRPQAHECNFVFAAFAHERLAYELARQARQEIAGARLKEYGSHAVEAHLWIAPPRVVWCQLLDRQTHGLHRRDRGAHVAVVTGAHPERADRKEHLPLPALLLLAPQNERARDHLRVQRLAVIHGADDARLAPGRRARIAGAPRVHERDACAGAEERERGPAAECARADDDDVIARGMRCSALGSRLSASDIKERDARDEWRSDHRREELAPVQAARLRARLAGLIRCVAHWSQLYGGRDAAVNLPARVPGVREGAYRPNRAAASSSA